jgi:flagella basal body P-ring formation protein FlgA
MIVRTLGFAILGAALAWLHGAAAAEITGPTSAEQSRPRLVANVSVGGNSLRLGDLFAGAGTRGDKVVARAPSPGQRYTLSAPWLASVARTYGLDWQPTGPFDRAVVYRPGQTIPVSEVVGAVRAELMALGLPDNFRLRTESALPTVTIAAAAARAIAIREPFFDPESGQFSAVAEIPAGDPEAQFLPARGRAEATVLVPVLTRNGARNQLIDADMVRLTEMADADVPDDAILDPEQIVGKAPRGFLRSGRPIRDGEVEAITLVEVPVLRRDMRRGDDIDVADLTMITVNADTFPRRRGRVGADSIGPRDFAGTRVERRKAPCGGPRSQHAALDRDSHGGERGRQSAADRHQGQPDPPVELRRPEDV